MASALLHYAEEAISRGAMADRLFTQHMGPVDFSPCSGRLHGCLSGPDCFGAVEAVEGAGEQHHLRRPT